MPLTREQLVRRGGPRTRTVAVPEWRQDGDAEDPTVVVRELTLAEQALVTGPDARKDPIGTTCKVLLVALVEPHLEPEDVAVLREAGSAAINRIGLAIMDLSGLNPDSQAKVQGK